MKIQRVLLPLFVLIGVIEGNAQQDVQVSQYIISPMLINPAFSSVADYWETNFVYRNQWVGIKDAPVTTYISTQSTIGKPHFSSTHKRDFHGWHGVGALIMKDQIGPLSTNRLKLNYSYNKGLTSGKKYGHSHEDGLRLAFGAVLDYSSVRIDKNLLAQSQNSSGDNVSNGDALNDVTFARISPNAEPVFDIDLGLMLYYNNTFFLGVSSSQVLQSTEVYGGYGGLRRHYYLTGMIKSPLNEQWFLISSVLVKSVNAAPVSLDVGFQLDWTDRIFLGTGYRYQDAVTLMIGYRHQWGEKIKHFRRDKHSYIMQFYYSYDITTSKLGQRSLEYGSTGSHEITLGFLLPPKYKERNAEDTWRRGNTNNLHKKNRK